MRFAVRSLIRSKGFAATVVLTMALGIGVNTAIFSVLRGVLLRPLVNRDAPRIIYIRQSAPALGLENATFSIPEIQDLRTRLKSFTALGDFSTASLTMLGLGEPREIRAGVVGSAYFDVMGLQAVMGRLFESRDDGPSAAGAIVLTHRFWTTALRGDPSVIGKAVRLGTRSAVVVGVLEPSVPYPAETEILANLVTSPHHLSATMMTGRLHRMTELFGRLAPGATLEQARQELQLTYAAMKQEHPEAYSSKGESLVTAVRLRDQLTTNAKAVLLLLQAAALLLFSIACLNAANLILARTIRREGELAIRASLGASDGSLRRILLYETLLLCGAGAVLGLFAASPVARILGSYASRFSARALDLKVDDGMLWAGAGLAVLAAVLLAFAPRLSPSARSHGMTRRNMRRLRVFAAVQVAASFVLIAGAGTLIRTLLALEGIDTGIDTRHVLSVNLPVNSYGRTPEQVEAFSRDAIRRIQALPGVDAVAIGSLTPWRERGKFGPGFQFTVEGHAGSETGENPRGRLRMVSAGYFAALGVPMLAGRDFDEADSRGSEPVVIVSRSTAQRMFPGRDALGRHLTWTDVYTKFVGITQAPQRIIGIAEDLDDENITPGAALTIYTPLGQGPLWGGRLFVHSHSDPYALVKPIAMTIRELSPDQPVERAATLADIRTEVLTPDRLNFAVFGGFAVAALLLAVLGVASVLAFSVSGRTREFGIRLAVGSQPRQVLALVIAEGFTMSVAGIAGGGACGFALLQFAASLVEHAHGPDGWVIVGAALVLLLAALAASAVPAARAARIDVIQALRAE